MVSYIPSAPKKCDNPVLGVLCGADAVGAIIGIILGGLVLIGLALFGILWMRRGRVRGSVDWRGGGGKGNGTGRGGDGRGREGALGLGWGLMAGRDGSGSG